MKKILSLALCVLMLLSVLAGCVNNNNNTDDNTKPSGTVGGNPEKPYAGVTLSIGIPENVKVEDYFTNDYTKLLEELTGMTLEFVKFPTKAADYKQKLATMLMSNQELPDILMGFALTEDLYNDYGEDGTFVDLREYVEDEEKSANFYKALEEGEKIQPGYRDLVLMLMNSANRTGGEGAMYGMPTIGQGYVDRMDFAPYINSQWLKNVGKTAPTTKEELVEVLRAFRDQDANGNGDPTDEIPMIGPKLGATNGDTISWLINFFIYWDDQSYFNIDKDGKVYLPVTQEKFREALVWIRSLITEGLLNLNTLTYNHESVKNVLATGDSVGVVVGQVTQTFAQGDGQTNPIDYVIKKYEPLNLYGYTHVQRMSPNIRTFITEDCDNVDAAYHLLMTQCQEEVGISMRYGVKGEHWEYSAEGVMSDLGMPCRIKVINDLWGAKSNNTWHTNIGVTYLSAAGNDLIETTGTGDFNIKKWQLFGAQYQNYYAAWDKTLTELGEASICPYIRFNLEEDDMAPNRETTKSDITVWINKFLDGTKDASNPADWNEYLQALQTAEVQKYLDAGQHWYDRVYPNGHVSK